MRSPAFAGINAFYAKGFPHSDTSGSKVARHLPEVYRRHATSFIASQSQGIHHTPLFSSTQINTHNIDLFFFATHDFQASCAMSQLSKCFQYIYPLILSSPRAPEERQTKQKPRIYAAPTQATKTMSLHFFEPLFYGFDTYIH